MRLLSHLKEEEGDDDTSNMDQDNDTEESILLQNCGNRGSIRSLGRVGGRWWMRSMRLPSSLTYRNMAFSELRSAAESVLRDERPRFATRSMLIKLLEDASMNTSSNNKIDVTVPRPLPPVPRRSDSPGPPRTESPVPPPDPS